MGRLRLPFFTAAVVGDSMLPGLRDGDWVLVLRTRRIRGGQVVATMDPRHPGRLVVKRAHGLRPDGWWVLGDNPEASTDSRQFGAVPRSFVVGRVLVRYYPLGLPRLV